MKFDKLTEAYMNVVKKDIKKGDILKDSNEIYKIVDIKKDINDEVAYSLLPWICGQGWDTDEFPPFYSKSDIQEMEHYSFQP